MLDINRTLTARDIKNGLNIKSSTAYSTILELASRDWIRSVPGSYPRSWRLNYAKIPKSR